VLVLEARNRAGGRVWTRRDDTTSYPIEMGPEWVAARGAWRKLLETVSAGLIDADGDYLERSGAALVKRGTLQQDIDALVAELIKQLPDGDDMPLTQALERYAGEARWRDAQRTLLEYVQGFHAADPSRVSMRWLAEVEESEPANASQARATAGLDWGIDALRLAADERAEIQFRSVVQHVEWQRGRVMVHASVANESRTFTAPQCVVTLPLAVLRAHEGALGAVRFTPPLGSKQRAMRLMDIGTARKIVMVFRDAFWKRDDALAGASFLQDPSQTIPTWWTTHPFEAPVLTGWVAGPQADALGDVAAPALLEAAVTSLASVAAVKPETIKAQLMGFHSHDWTRDPYAGGAYPYVLVEGTGAFAQLAAPVQDTLFFAGEATAGKGHNATMEGALQSGYRAAAELLR
jgi:monoamine oxidase